MKRLSKILKEQSVADARGAFKMEKGALLYEGKAKQIYATNDEQVVWIEYKDSATAFNGGKKAEIQGKGRLNNEITSLIFKKLKEKGIESHFIERLSETEQLVKKVYHYSS